MKAFLETTVWDTATPNHVYFLDDSKSKMFAYVKFGSGKPFKFKNPIRIDTRGRKFKEVPNTWKFSINDYEPEGRVWIVKGSKGDDYKVTEVNGNLSCTCSGFRFRGDCRHVKSVS
jgi:hypothetical protein